MEWWENRILSAQNGTNPMPMMALKNSYAVFGDVQFLPGYCVLLPKLEVNSLNDLSLNERTQFLKDMAFLGDALINVCQPLRVNYDILGNTDAYLHAHVFPRYKWETDERRKMPVWLYPQSNWNEDEYKYNPDKHEKLREKITSYLHDNYLFDS